MNENPSEAELLQAVVTQALLGVHTIAPGIIESYDSSKRRASVQPAFQEVWEDGAVTTQPIIPSCPVAFPAGGGFSISWDMKRGDPCLILFSERSLDAWLSAGGVVDPDDGRFMDITDAIVLPQLQPFSSVTEGAGAGEMRIESESGMAITMTDTGKVTIGTPAVELLEQISQVIAQAAQGFQTLSTDVIPTAIGPQKPVAFAVYAACASSLNAIKSLVDSIKG